MVIAQQACGKRTKSTNTPAQLHKQTIHSRVCPVLATALKEPRVAAMLPASTEEQSFKEVYLQGQQTAESGETEGSRAGAKASAHEYVPSSCEASKSTAVVHYL